jgi:FixJ family two-component response regulator
MNTITQETPLFQRFSEPASAKLSRGEGSKLHSTYFEFHVNLPVVIGVAVSEMSDSELLVAAEKAGTFDFLNTPEEDGYNDLLPPRE